MGAWVESTPRSERTMMQYPSFMAWDALAHSSANASSKEPEAAENRVESVIDLSWPALICLIFARSSSLMIGDLSFS